MYPAVFHKLRTCPHRICVRIFEHNFVAEKAKMRRRAGARQAFLTQSAAKFAEKTCVYAYADRFLFVLFCFRCTGRIIRAIILFI